MTQTTVTHDKREGRGRRKQDVRQAPVHGDMRCILRSHAMRHVDTATRMPPRLQARCRCPCCSGEGSGFEAGGRINPTQDDHLLRLHRGISVKPPLCRPPRLARPHHEYVLCRMATATAASSTGVTSHPLMRDPFTNHSDVIVSLGEVHWQLVGYAESAGRGQYECMNACLHVYYMVPL